MFLLSLHTRTATAVRLIGLALIIWSIAGANIGPGLSGRHLVVSVSLALSVAAWLYWTWRPGQAGGTLSPGPVRDGRRPAACSPRPHRPGAGSAFVFVAAVSAGVREELGRAWPVPVLGGLSLAVMVLVYDRSGTAALAYCLGFAGSTLAASTARQGAAAHRAGRAAARPDPALPGGAAARGASAGVDPARARDPRRARALARRTDDPARGDDRADRGRRRPGCDPGAACAAPTSSPARDCRRPAARSARCAARRRASPRRCVRWSPVTATADGVARRASRSMPSPPS